LLSLDEDIISRLLLVLISSPLFSEEEVKISEIWGLNNGVLVSAFKLGFISVISAEPKVNVGDGGAKSLVLN